MPTPPRRRADMPRVQQVRCIYCGVEFLAANRSTRFCRSRCRSAATRAGVNAVRWAVVDANGAMVGGSESYETAAAAAFVLPAAMAVVQARTGGVVWKRAGFQGLGPLVAPARPRHRVPRGRGSAPGLGSA